jgi:hypothetical protein
MPIRLAISVDLREQAEALIQRVSSLTTTISPDKRARISELLNFQAVAGGMARDVGCASIPSGLRVT